MKELFNFREAFIIILASLFLFTSCDLFKPAQGSGKEKVTKENNKDELDEIQGKRVYNPETGEWEVVNVLTEKLDTIRWKDLSTEKFPPILSDGAAGGTPIDPTPPPGPTTQTPEGSIIKTTYNITALLPFFAHQFTSTATELPRNSIWATHFYSGMKMAKQVLQEEGINLNLTVIDTKGNEQEVQSLLRSNTDISGADLIIGPYRRDNVKIVAQFAKQRGITFVSPYSATMQLSSANPNYIQLNPSLKTHCEGITKHVRERYDVKEVVIIAQNDRQELELVQYFQEANQAYDGGRDTTRFEEYIVKDQSADFHEMNVKPYIRDNETTVFIVPSYRNETFIYSLLRQLAVAKRGGDRIVVYGLPPWMNYDRIDYDFYENLNVHVSTAQFADNLDPNVQIFQRRYFNEFGMPPTEEVFMGYDALLYCGRKLKEYGTKFQYYVEQDERTPYLQTTFDLERVINNPNPRFETLNKVDQFENKFVHILKFQNYHFQPSN